MDLTANSCIDQFLHSKWNTPDRWLKLSLYLLSVPQGFNSFHQSFLSAIVQFLAFVMHVDHSFILKICATIISGIFLSSIEFFSFLARLIMGFLFSRGKFFITKDAEIFPDYKWRFFFTFHTDIWLICSKVYYSEFFPTI